MFAPGAVKCKLAFEIYIKARRLILIPALTTSLVYDFTTMSTKASRSHLPRESLSVLPAVTAIATAAAPVPAKPSPVNFSAAVGAPVAIVGAAFLILLVWFLIYHQRTKVALDDLQKQVAAEKDSIIRSLSAQELGAGEKRIGNLKVHRGRHEIEGDEWKLELPT